MKTKEEVDLFRKRLFKLITVLSVIVTGILIIKPWYQISFNITNSIDGYVFLIEKNKKPEKGGLVAFWPPKNDFIHERYWFVKYMKGVPGDEITREGRDFFINGEFVGRAKEKSLSGVPLKASKQGVLGDDEYFVWTAHEDSFDSRYKQIGWIKESSFIGRAYRIF